MSWTWLVIAAMPVEPQTLDPDIAWDDPAIGEALDRGHEAGELLVAHSRNGEVISFVEPLVQRFGLEALGFDGRLVLLATERAS